MEKLKNLVWTELYRPKTFSELVCSFKNELEEHLKNPMKMPSYIFHSSSPGTGKTTTARLIASILKCDLLTLNASKDRGVDVIREKVCIFAEHMSSNDNVKKMVFLDEADFLTPVAQASLRNIIEDYSDSVFFVFSCNDLSKVIQPIVSRCVVLGFDNPPKKEILNRLEYICQKEDLKYDIETLAKLIEMYYPDLRSAVISLQNFSLDKQESLLGDYLLFEEFYKALRRKNMEYIYKKTYDSSMNILCFTKWFMKYLMKNHKDFSFNQLAKTSQLIADVEKSWNLSANIQIIFLANMLEIANILE